MSSSIPKPEDEGRLPTLRLGRNPGQQVKHDQVERQALTPMMRHYAEMKDQYLHTLLLYRVGDFYETFFQDACTIAQELELVLTSKDAGKEIGKIAMAGVPHHALERYCQTLVERGYAIAICDQVEDPALVAQGTLVKREVTRIFTPGTVLETGMLNASRNNFLAAIVLAGQNWGLAYADVSTGEFLTTQSNQPEQLTQELLRLQPAEVLLPTQTTDLNRMLRPGEVSEHLPNLLPTQLCYTLRSPADFDTSESRQRLLTTFGIRSLEGLGCERLTLAARAAGGLLAYLEDTQKNTQIPLQALCTYTLSEYLVLDYQSRRNLEITQTCRDGSYHGSLLWALDKTSTAMGSRALRRWLLQPLLQIHHIQARQQTIQELIDHASLRRDIQAVLQQIYDLERLAGRAGSGTANARDLLALADSLERVRDLSDLAAVGESVYLQALQSLPPALEELGTYIKSYLVENPPLSLTEGGVIRSQINPELDRLRQQLVDDQQWLTNLETLERKRTGISSLKVSFNKAFGYYISISRAKADQAPEDYIRRQTLTTEERYITPELKERETRIFNAQSDLYQLEYEIFGKLRTEVGEHAVAIRKLAAAVAAIDVLVGLAEIAVYQGYCCPQMVDSRQITIQAGRHPVVEKSLPTGFFVPNSTELGGASSSLDPDTAQTSKKSSARSKSSPQGPTAVEMESVTPDLVILTGPNASGKSCYLRQVGLIQLMAQVGSFVPAERAVLGICDRIFTRVGAVDDLATGQSTFMVEMNETANILNHATPESLVLLDEIGRGTATFDGLAIAWSVAEYLATAVQARTIFATHYHELNELASLLPNVANYQVVVKELPDQIIFLHQVKPGGASRSYGIEAGRLAGLPAPVLQRARQVMQQIERHSKIVVHLRKGSQQPLANVKQTAKSDSPNEATDSEQFELPF
jgi:DNA mismatch repair protein MutS